MTTQLSNHLDHINTLIQQNLGKEALEIIKQLHRQHHDQAIAHLQVHGYWFYLGWKQKNVPMLLGQLLPLLFALPVSWMHKGLGIAINAHKHHDN